MIQILATAIPAVIAAVVSLITFFSNKNSKVLKEIEQLKDEQAKFKEDYALDKAKQARTRILRFNNELMCGGNFTKEYFEDIIENSIDVYETYYKDPNHKNLKNGIAKSAVKNIYRIYDENIRTNSFLQYPKEVTNHEGTSDHAGCAAC
ncbi:MAG: hypothetical protein LIR46_04400 [Bacteroidota bacterium]|nr:hypothetical protein [Bacteroidota bacterium]